MLPTVVSLAHVLQFCKTWAIDNSLFVFNLLITPGLIVILLVAVPKNPKKLLVVTCPLKPVCCFSCHLNVKYLGNMALHPFHCGSDAFQQSLHCSCEVYLHFFRKGNLRNQYHRRLGCHNGDMWPRWDDTQWVSWNCCPAVSNSTLLQICDLVL